MRLPRLACILAVWLAAAMPAMAAEGFNAHLLHPTPFAGRFLTFEDTQTLPQWHWAIGALAGYANAPVEIRQENARTTGVLDSLLTTDLTGAFSVHDMINFGLHAPVHWFSRGRSFDDLGAAEGYTSRQNRTAMGDMRLTAKVRFWDEGFLPFGLAAIPFVTFPTGDAERMLGDGRMTWGVTATYEIDAVFVRLGLNGGWHYRGGSKVLGTDVRNAFPLGLGLSRDIIENVNLSLEAHGEIYESADGDDFAGNPVEMDLVGRWEFLPGLRLLAGGGPGLTSGVGSPDFRLFAGVDFHPIPAATPPPSTGNLRVVVQDEDDQPLEAEVNIEGPLLRLGNTTQGEYALADLPPGTYRVQASRPDYQTGTAEAVHVYAGQTTTVTVVLQRPSTTLVVSVSDKDNGALLPGQVIFHPGTDHESTADNPTGELSMPFASGPVALTAEAKGYEAVMTKADVVANTTTTVTIQLRKKIEKIGRIYFEYDSAVLRSESKPVLDDVARQIKQLQSKRVIVEGHCSEEGTDEYNLKLSHRRAEAVRDYLIAHGVDGDILSVMAFGESRPIASNETEAGREKNRRVEFIIEEE